MLQEGRGLCHWCCVFVNILFKVAGEFKVASWSIHILGTSELYYVELGLR